MRFLTACIAVLISTVHLQAATYYVDYDSGSDSDNGTSESTPWKHAPGDPAASGNADITPAAGDVIMLKGGVHYKGKISINFNGASGSPITYKGDGWGTGKAVIDGSDEVTGWTRCTNAGEAGGNSNYANIWVADAPAGLSALEANLFLGDSLAYVAQYPNQTDPFWMDNRSNYLTATSISKTSAASDEIAAIGSGIAMGHIYVDVSGNNVDNAAITAYGGGAVTFSISHDPATSKKYSIANVVHETVFDCAGEYVVDEDAGKIYLWPWDGMDPSALTVTVSVRQEVMQFNASDYIVVDGITFIKTTGKVSYGNGSNGLTIKNCDYHHCRSGAIDNALDLVNQHNLLVEGCSFWRNARMRGVVARRSGSTLQNCSVKNNSFVKIGRTAIFLYEVNGGEIIGNYTKDGRGVHSNAYSCYSDHSSDPCRNVTISDNFALNSNNSLTFYGVDTMLIVNNLFDGSGTDWSMSCWNSVNSLNVTILHNNLVNSGSARAGFFVLPEATAQMPTAVIKNNIIDGMRNLGGDIGYNLYTMYASAGQAMGLEGDVVNFNKDLIFTDWAAGDWTLIPTSPAVDAGTDMGVTVDIDGTARPKGSAPDKGCYEYDPAGIGDDLNGNGLAIGGIVIPNPVRAMAGALIVEKAILEQGADVVRLFTMVGQPVENLRTLTMGCYLLQHGQSMRRIMVVD